MKELIEYLQNRIKELNEIKNQNFSPSSVKTAQIVITELEKVLEQIYNDTSRRY